MTPKTTNKSIVNDPGMRNACRRACVLGVGWKSIGPAGVSRLEGGREARKGSPCRNVTVPEPDADTGVVNPDRTFAPSGKARDFMKT